jgi:uncharacterized membrane protein
MAFCPTCGAPAEGRFCAKCGSSLTAPAASGEAAPGPEYSEGAASPGAQGGYAVPPGQAVGLTDNVAGLLCYVLGLITGILFLALAPYNRNKFVRFHALQAIFFHVAFIALWFAGIFTGFIVPWALGMVASLMGMLIWLAFVATWVLLMVKAWQGERFKLPVIGDLAEKHA